MSRALLVIGQSHVAAFRDAAALRRQADPDAPRTRVIHTREQHYDPELVDDAAGTRLAPPLAAAIAEQRARHDPLIVSVTGGNVHAVLGLIRHERPFDFRLSGEPSPPLDPQAELLPEALVSATLTHAMARDLDRLRALHAEVGDALVHLDSPPPLRDDRLILAAADAWFVAAGVAHRGVAHAGLRYRLWRLAGRLVAAECARLGCGWRAVPAAVRDADGFLASDLAGNATHGNARYGAIMIEALAR